MTPGTRNFIKSAFIVILLIMPWAGLSAQPVPPPILTLTDGKTNTPSTIRNAKPLQRLSLVGAFGSTATVTDGQGKTYSAFPVQPVTSFIVGGALGKHTITLTDKKGKKVSELTFEVDAETAIDDGGRYRQMFDLFKKGMFDFSIEDGSQITWNGKTYHYFVPWGLDHNHTMKGLKYFSPYGAEFVDLMRAAQREDGMIWSFVTHDSRPDYFITRDSVAGYTRKIGDRYFTRQPTENHPEYIYVETIYQCWKASGDDAWMKENLSSAARALNYSMNDPARWSKRFGLLKRVYTIDSWDFQVDDAYTPEIGLTNTMIIDPVKSKFGVFFGDNTNYAFACNALSEMYDHAGRQAEAAAFRQRAKEITDRLNALSWNGRFFTHFIDEDPAVKRNLGVDEKSQIAQSNAYSTNLELPHEKNRAIIETYLDLKNHLPVGSPGEWYAIYPPFENGFDRHDAKWQYMNGGVGGHVAGELARGAYENGYEEYATDILNRLFDLGKKYNNKIWFAYTGAIPLPPAPPAYKPIKLSGYANMDTWDKGGTLSFPWMLTKKTGDDLRNLPAGEQTLANIKFQVIDPEKNNRKAVVAVSKRKGFPAEVEIPVADSAACVYFLHTSTKPTSEKVSGAVSLLYTDGTTVTRYMIMDKQLTYWWFSRLKTDYSGIAWYGKNEVSNGVGLSWCAVDNPNPRKVISKIILHAPEDEGIYTVLGITLADKPHYVPINPVSFGGPDNWASATAMAALVEGLAGVKDAPLTQAFSEPLISPRWNETNSDSLQVTIRYAASTGYVAYQYVNRPEKKQLELVLTTNGKGIRCHLLLPNGVTLAKRVTLNKTPISFTTSTVEKSFYTDFTIKESTPATVLLEY